FPLCSHAETHFEAAQRLMQAGQETEARRALKLEVGTRPANLEARFNLAVLLERIGHDDEAVILYRVNMKRGRHLPSVVNLSAWLRNHGQNREAETLLKQATQDFRSEAVPWYLLAEMAQEKGNDKQASSFFKRAIKADKKNGFAHLRYARFLAINKPGTEAVIHARSAVRLLPTCAPCLNIAGDIFAKAGEKKQALVVWQKSIAIAPDAALRSKILHAQNITP
ncbi:MAG: tetratricopeptide repeat protein, partial [Mariprofundaceae bacterium]|nr:tetratricopeptide repeat protein [Mariprofundaceae bacterium]